MDAEFPERVELVSVRVPVWIRMAPPLVDVEFPERVELEIVTVPVSVKMPPPPPLKPLAVLPENVELEIVRVPLLRIPPPPFCAELPERVELEMERVALVLFQMPPPLLAVLPDRVELEMERVPALLNPPPLAEVFAPETVTPEMVKSPPEAMLKMLKSRLLLPPSKPLIIREEEPGPLMVSVPTVVPVPPVPEAVAVASKISGNAPARVMV